MSGALAEPASQFTQFGLASVLEQAVADAGFSEPRPIQEQAIPAVLEGRDVMGLAQTGTGKTAAFALPLLHRLLESRDRPGPRVLVVAPTRELVLQIESDFRKLSKGARIGSVAIFGGVSERPQIAQLRKRPQVVVACPGRLLDLAGRRLVHLDRIESLVLDEADHMFDMGFLPDVRRIVAALPEERQNLLFSATMPPEIRHLADNLLDEPFVVELTRSKPAETIAHSLLPVPDGRKLDLLREVLDEDGVFSAIVFTRTKRRAHRLARQLSKGGHRAVSLQGDMSQGARERALSGFRAHRFDVLVATDIVARGIDVEAVSHVINFDIPSTPEAYTHRIGRTGRAERQGRAYTLVTEEDRSMVHSIELMLGKPIPRRTVEGFEGVHLPAPTEQALLSEIARRARCARGGRQSERPAAGSRGRGRGRGRKERSWQEQDRDPRHRDRRSSSRRSGGGDDRRQPGHSRPRQEQDRDPRRRDRRSSSTAGGGDDWSPAGDGRSDRPGRREGTRRSHDTSERGGSRGRRPGRRREQAGESRGSGGQPRRGGTSRRGGGGSSHGAASGGSSGSGQSSGSSRRTESRRSGGPAREGARGTQTRRTPGSGTKKRRRRSNSKRSTPE